MLRVLTNYHQLIYHYQIFLKLTHFSIYLKNPVMVEYVQVSYHKYMLYVCVKRQESKPHLIHSVYGTGLTNHLDVKPAAVYKMWA